MICTRYKIIACIAAMCLAATQLGGCAFGNVLDVLKLFSDETYEIVSDAPRSASSYSEDLYAYHTLDGDILRVYDELYEGIVNMDDTFRVSTDDDDVLSDAILALQADHGEIFYVDGYSYYSAGLMSGFGFRISPNYTMSIEERDYTQSMIDAVVDSWLGEISVYASDYDKSKWVYETLIRRVDYVADSPDNQNIISVFLNGETVCQGYASAAQYLLRKLGIQSVIVPGYVSGGAHAWNMVRLDGEYYYMDVTWGNSNYYGSNDEKSVVHNCLNITTDDITRTHDIDASFDLPICNASRDNYYRQEGCYFETFNSEQMGKLIHNGFVRGEDVEIKCANDSVYDAMKQYFIDDYNFTLYCNGLRTLRYTLYAEGDVIVFHFL